jgi:hypothetical protein
MSEKKNSDIIKQEAPVKKNSTFEEFNENTLRVRRNLLIFSVIALFYKLSGATLTGKSSFLGLEFEHIDPEMIDLFLLWIIIYHYIHFLWLVFEHNEHHNLTMKPESKKFIWSWWNLYTSNKKIAKVRFIRINYLRHILIEQWLPLLMGIFAVCLLEN